MPSKDTKIFNKYQKSDKAPFFIYVDLECLSEHIPSGFSMSTISSFRSIENKHDVYRGKDCMKKFCKSLREHAMQIMNFQNEKIYVIN